MNIYRTEILAILSEMEEDVNDGCDIYECIEDARLAIDDLFSRRASESNT